MTSGTFSKQLLKNLTQFVGIFIKSKSNDKPYLLDVYLSGGYFNETKEAMHIIIFYKKIYCFKSIGLHRFKIASNIFYLKFFQHSIAYERH